LEQVFRTELPDLQLVLFGGRADSDTLVGRVNFPTAPRMAGKYDFGIEVHTPVPIAADLTANFVAGSTYSVRLSPDVRICCDTGDNACTNVPSDAEIPEGSVNRSIGTPQGNPDKDLRFDLSTFRMPDLLANDSVIASHTNHFQVKAEKDQSNDPALPLAHTDLICTIEKGGATLATGALALQPSAGLSEQIGPFTGTLQLKYGSTKIASSKASPRK
jgi:hypothetical protein